MNGKINYGKEKYLLYFHHQGKKVNRLKVTLMK